MRGLSRCRVDRQYAVRMSPALTLALVVLAVARATRLLTSDRILDRPRRWLVIRLWARTLVRAERERSPGWDMHMVRHGTRVTAADRLGQGGDPPLGAYLVTCPWCVSVYVGAAAAPLWYWFGDSPWVIVPAAALAASYVTGFLAGKEA